MDSVTPIEIYIPKYEDRVQDKVITYFIMDVKLGNKQWTIEKRYSQFHDLYSSLKLKYADLPFFPGKSYWKLKHEGIEQRRIQLQEFCRGVSKRLDIRMEPYYRDFFELDKHNSQALYFSPMKIAELDDLPLGVRDFIYINDMGWLILALSDMRLASRLDAYLTNAQMPWEKKKSEDEQSTFATVGALAFYKVGVELDGKNWNFFRQWAKNFPSQTNILHWVPEERMVIIGLDSGKIHLFKVTSNNLGLEEVGEEGPLVSNGFKAHTKRVMGLSFDLEQNYIFSIGEDNFFKITDLNVKEPIHQQQYGLHGLKSMIHDKDNKRFFLGDGDGFIYILSYKEDWPPQEIAKIQSKSRSCIRSMTLDDDKYFIFTGDVEGYINSFSIGAPGKERFIKQVSEGKGMPKIRQLNWSELNGELFASNQNGKITIFDAKKSEPITVVEAHTEAITKTQWFEKSRYLFTGSKDKSLKVWEFPKNLYWMKENASLEEVKEVEAEQQEYLE